MQLTFTFLLFHYRPHINSIMTFGLKGHHHIDHEYKSMYSYTEN
jgi:hypothetical protein